MLKKCRNMLRNEKGLTLIELLAVVVILGIIAAIAIPSFANIIKNAERDAIVADGRQVMSAARLAIISEPNEFRSETSISHSDLDAYLEKLDSDKWTSITVSVSNGEVTGAVITLNGTAGTIELDENGQEVDE